MKKDLKNLLESLNVTDENKIAIANYLQEAVKDIKTQCFEEMTKKYNVDSAKTVEALNTVTNKVIAEEKKKVDLHRKKLIEMKIALQKDRDNLDKELADRTAAIKEEYAKKFEDAKAKIIKENAESFNAMVSKVQDFINTNVKNEVANLRSTKHKLHEAIENFGSFITDQTRKCAELHRNEAKKYDALKVRLVKENYQKVAQAKKDFYNATAEKVQTFINEQMEREIKNFRADIINARKNDFGVMIFETFKKAFAKDFFKTDKVAKGLLENVNKKINKLEKTVEKLDSEKNTLLAENKNLSVVKEKLMREKIINEGISFLSADKQAMMRNLLTGTKTSELKESIRKYLPAIVDKNQAIKINNNRMLKENKTVLTGADNNKSSKVENIDSNIDDEIAKIVASAKF